VPEADDPTKFKTGLGSESGPLSPAQEGIVNYYEILRKRMLSSAAGVLMAFIDQIQSGDPSVRKPAGPAKPGDDPKAKMTANTAAVVSQYDYLALKAPGGDWVKAWYESAGKENDIMTVLLDVADLFLKNAKLDAPHLLYKQCKPNVMAQGSGSVFFCPLFFETRDDPTCQLVTLIHEHFHLLSVPHGREFISHAEKHQSDPPYMRVLTNAADLTTIAMRLVLGKDADFCA
jgi:hypothetical protein